MSLPSPDPRLSYGAPPLLEPAVLGLLYWRQRQGPRGPHPPRRTARLSEPRAAERPPGLGPWRKHRRDAVPAAGRRAADAARTVCSRHLRNANLGCFIARRLPPGALHQFVPLDVPRYVRRFLDHWQPDLALVAESEIWPNTIVALDQRHIPLVLVNARMSDRSFRRWQKLPRIIGALLERLALCFAQTRRRCGAPRDPRRASRRRDGQSQIRFPAAARRSARGGASVGTARGSAGLVCGEHPSGRGERDPRGSPGARSAPSASTHDHRAATSASRGGDRGDRRKPRPACKPALGGHPAGPGDRRLRRRYGGRDGPVLPRCRRSSSWAVRWSRMADKIRSSPRSSARPFCTARTCTISRTSMPARTPPRGALMVKDSASLARAVSELLSNPRSRATWRGPRRTPCRRWAARSTAPCSRSSPSFVQAKLGARR